MADRFSPEQVQEIDKCVKDAKASGESGEVTALDIVKAWQASEAAPFTKEELQGMAKTLESLALPLSSRTKWPAPPSSLNETGRGLFFVFEGLDRSGKSTQSKLLTKHFEAEGLNVKWTCFPNRATAMGSVIDLYLRKKLDLSDKVIHEFFSANRWESASTLVASLNQGTTVICDRYAFSGVAYTAAKGLDFEWCKAPDRGLPAPDAIFYLHVDPKVGQSRANFGDERYENATMQANVRKEFQRPELRAGVSWHDVDGDRPIDDIHAEIRKAVDAVRAEKGQSAVEPLWMGDA
mmetsp:Transcript_24460/g.56863  ORF Transcript_24460/g.56863 Transcript_24460/m.56863 type:complete len:293 (-) Transcript_24460:68-946(-)|eukprot:CAMPEP_0178406970 /NCGR_PEP_ID=MMETSP0689_2-20121128/19187_1 /TAXON_ID=160604 /ORGANISM="Amphidinium massartii, Strain CS-259" /LENGTH=292 /DNA_ID=CAMNT_0020028029 /DNA_START=68 /DNA_END=946 /DNA_ORIENTATION=-